jgi:DNA-binding IscR family transcriptional regulator
VTEHDCAVRRVFQQVRDETARILDGTTLTAAAHSPQPDDDRDTRHVIELGGPR